MLHNNICISISVAVQSHWIIRFWTDKEIRKLTQDEGCISLGTRRAMQQHLPVLLGWTLPQLCCPDIGQLFGRTPTFLDMFSSKAL